MDNNNKVSAELRAEAKQQIISGLTEIEGLLPFLITLTKEERKRLRKMGAKSVEYVQMCYFGARTHAEYMRANFNLDEYGKDTELVQSLQEIHIVLQTLTEKVGDTLMTVKSEAMVASDESYSMLKQAAKKDGAVKTLVDQIAARFRGQGAKKDRLKKD